MISALLLAAAVAPPLSSVVQTALGMHGFNVDTAANGSRYAFVEGGRDKNGHEEHQLFIARRSAQPTRLNVPSKYSFDEIALSPDGSRIAFLGSDGHTSGLYMIDSANARVSRVAALSGEAQDLSWSPDGRHLGMLYIAHPHRKAGALAAGAREVGVIGSVVDEQQLATVDAHTGAVALVTPADDYVYEYDWSPDASRFAFTYAKGNGDNNWWIAKLATSPARAHAPLADLYKPPLQINEPRWSPDGKSIALIGGLMSDFGAVGGDVYVIDAATGTARDATPGWHESAARISYVGNNRLFVVADANGAQHLQFLNLADGSTSDADASAVSYRDLAISRDGAFLATAREDFDHPAEVWAGAPNALHRVSNVNAGTPKYYGQTKSLNWTNDQFTVQGWLIYPMGYDRSRTYPMVTIIHGGPSSQTGPSFDSRTVAGLTSRGFFVFEPNPRGSFGQGEAFTAANVKDFGYGDWRDDLTGIDAAIKAEPAIDGSRLGLYGWSYGGYMTMWAETQTTRFKAIVSGAGVVNWQSYYGQNNINQWMTPFFGATVYDDPAVYAKSSPITFIKNSKTPILILQGERDEEVPAPQAFEFYNAMQALHVPSQLVVYADEGHSPAKFANRVDIATRIADWFTRYLR